MIAPADYVAHDLLAERFLCRYYLPMRALPAARAGPIKRPWLSEDQGRQPPPDRIRIIKHEAIPGCGSYEVRFPDDRESRYFYSDALPSRRLRPETLDPETASDKGRGICEGCSRN
jgi:hypothetical protein